MADYIHIDGKTVSRLLSEHHDMRIIDVRSRREFSESRIPGAQNIDIMASNAIEVLTKLRKDLPYLIYCSIGVRSISTVKMMADLGFTDLYHLDNGLNGYNGPIDETSGSRILDKA
ncbi:MAG: hypothetical protein GC181_12255 [Bacteroidetes bacterium]|nr:hypothetical protein [Bacteroidota bacterium]